MLGEELRLTGLARTPESLIREPASAVVKWLVENNPRIEQLTLLAHPLRTRWTDDEEPEHFKSPASEGGSKAELLVVFRDQILAGLPFLGLRREGWNLKPDEPEFFSVASSIIHPSCIQGSFFEDQSVTHEVRHIPMLEFGRLRTPANLKVVLEALRKQGQKGWILDAGDHWQFWGRELLSPAAWEQFLTRNRNELLVDQKFVTRTIVDGASYLRISARRGNEKLRRASKPAPKVIAVL